MSVAQREHRSGDARLSGHRRRAAGWINVGLFLAGVISIAGSLTFIFHRPAVRAQIDATKTRAYSLSNQTQTLLNTLEGDWRISFVLVESDVERATLRQIDEVLKRYAESSKNISVERIDPTNPASVPSYERLISRMEATYGEEIAAYEESLDEARDAYSRAVQFAANEAAALQALMAQLAPDEPLRALLETVHGNFALFARNGGEVVAYVDQALATGETKPIPDYEAARDALSAALSAAAADIASTASMYQQWMTRSGVPTTVQAYLARARVQHDEFAIELQEAADPLLHLEPLEITKIGEELARGEAAVITGPEGAAVIPAHQMLPRTNLRATREGGITFDQRFRGEQLLSSTIQSMVIDPMPMVVFVHSLSRSILEPIEGRADYFGAATMLRLARYDVREWKITEMNRPQVAAATQRAVWIIVPSTPGQDRRSLELSREEELLISRTDQLIGEGAPVLISFFPSVLHKLSQPDPWQGHLGGFGIEVDTARVVLNSQLGEGGQRSQVQWLDQSEFTADHPIARAVDGQLLRLPAPLPIRYLDESSTGVQRWSLVTYEPGPNRWLEDDWVDAIRNGETSAPVDKRFEEPVPLVVAASRIHPVERDRRQRAIIVGSGTWLQSALADVTQNLGGERVALLFPGNYEFFLASVAWLAGLDELIARSPTAQQVARLDGINEGVRRRWRWIALGVMPGACLAFGIGVWFVRRM